MPRSTAGSSRFVELLRRDHDDGEVLDVGCGPGTVAAHLARLGVAVRGVDLSPAMVELARREHPTIPFTVGEMGALDAPEDGLAGLVAWYSLIHVPEAHRAAVVAEFRRVLRPGGYVLLAFQIGDDTLHLDRAFEREIALDFHRLRPDAVVALLTDAGFELTARLERAPDVDTGAERRHRGFLLARRRP